MNEILVAKDLCFSWGAFKEGWFQDLNLSLQGGYIYGLLGRNGAGKTTLIKLLTGCLRPSSGGSFLHLAEGPTNVKERRPATLEEMVFVPESIELPSVTVTAFGELTGCFYPRFQMERYLSYLQDLEVPRQGMLDRLSFGQRRKTHIALALATDAAIIFLDEPTNGLDIASQLILRQMLRRHLTPHRSLIVSTHHVREFEDAIDFVTVLDHGKIMANELVADLKLQPGFQNLESWYAQLLGIGL